MTTLLKLPIELPCHRLIKMFMMNMIKVIEYFDSMTITLLLTLNFISVVFLYYPIPSLHSFLSILI